MNKSNYSNSSDRSRNSSAKSSERSSSPPAKIISGWEHAVYAHRNTDRYAYIGKEDGEPQWVDWGKKSDRK